MNTLHKPQLYIKVWLYFFEMSVVLCAISAAADASAVPASADGLWQL